MSRNSSRSAPERGGSTSRKWSSVRTDAGLYVHVPFCERLCPYCDFAVSVQAEIPHRAYTDAVINELRGRAEELEDREVVTMYFGGGTPALLAPTMLGEIIDRARELFDVAGDAEITLETNPNQVTEQNLGEWRAIGVERLSIGCQSFQDRHLHRLRRNHDGQTALDAARRAASAMQRVSIDLIFAGPDQPMQEWEADLEAMQGLVTQDGVDHISAYNLTIEPGTTFAIRQRQGILEVPDDNTAAKMLERLVDACRDVGLRRYEVSNFARPGAESRHNSGYWIGRPYLGVGVGAHSLIGDERGAVKRRANPRNFDEYMGGVEAAAAIEELSPREHLAERLFLGARTIYGVDLAQLEEQFDGVDDQYFERAERALQSLVTQELMEHRGGRAYRPTDRGLNFADSIAQKLFEAVTD